ncbi:MAG: hypothetical protein K2N52_04055, partial [Clostridia bacterium]|nr:hypothetical protein [Clostridia bacterium]
MKKYNKANKKILATLAVFAVSATTVCSAAAFAGCSNPDSSDNNDANVATTKIATAIGEVVSRSSGTTYYVAPDGLSTNDGLSTDSPMDIRSILNEGTSPLQPGDTVLVAPGHYMLAENNPTEKITMLVSGEYNKYITIRNASETGEPCVLDFSNQSFDSTNRGVSIYGDYVYWYGIDICGAGDNGMYIGGSFNTVEYCDFYNNRDTGLQLGRSYSEYSYIDTWPNYNLVKNCTSHNNYDNETYGENADGFAAKLTVGYGNVFDGCIAYRNSDDGWDLYAKTESGNIGTVIMYNCVAYENGFIEYTQKVNNARFESWNGVYNEENTNSYLTRDGDGNGFKLGGSTMEGDVLMYNCLSFNNRMHGVTDNSNPGVLSVKGVTSYNNGAAIDNDPSSEYFGLIRDVENGDTHANIDLSRQTYSYNNISHVLSVGDSYNNYTGTTSNLSSDALRGSSIDSVLITVSGGTFTYYALEGANDVQSKVEGFNFATLGTKLTVTSTDIFKQLPFTKSEGNYTFNITGMKDLYADDTETALNPNRAHIKYRNSDGSVNMGDLLAKKDGVDDKLIAGENIGSTLNKNSYQDYEHFYLSDLVDNTVSSSDEATVKRAAETLKLTLTCDPEAVYQDFDLVNKMINVSIKWGSSDESLLVVDDSYVDISVSHSEYIKAVVYRDPQEDKHVTLTAYLTCGNAHE